MSEFEEHADGMPPSADDGPAAVRGAPAGRTPIEVTSDEDVVVDAAVRAIAGHPAVYQRANLLVHVLRDEAPLEYLQRPRNAPRIALLPAPYLRTLSTRVIYWHGLKFDRKGNVEEVQLHPPQWAILAVHSRGHWAGVRALEGVAEVPVLRPDGSVWATPGYDAQTGVVYDPACAFAALPEAPTRDAARAALAVLREPFADFPIVSEAHRAVAFAALLTPLARRAFRGPAPLFLVDASTRGTGKSMLADVVAEVATGRPMPRMAPVDDDNEMRKAITSLALSGTALVLVDNVAGRFGGPSVDVALTGETWRDRVLGESRDVEIPFGATWFVTGNNVALAGDLARRTAHIRLESPLENPELRAEFQHPDLLGWVRAHRGALVTAALTLLRAYILAGRPDQGLSPWGSFEGWSGTVRHALVWAGAADPGATREQLTEDCDTTTGALGDLVAGWEEVATRFNGQCTTNQALGELARNDAESSGPHPSEPRRYGRLREALAALCKAPPGKLPTARSVGNHLRAYKGRVVAGKALAQGRERTKDGVVWAVRRVAAVPSGDSGDSGDSGSGGESPRFDAENRGRTAPGDSGDSDSTLTHENDFYTSKYRNQSHYSHQSHRVTPPDFGDSGDSGDVPTSDDTEELL